MKENDAYEKLFKELITNNKLGIQDEKTFEIISRNYTITRSDELRANPIQGNFNYKHLKDIHKYIFQDVFYWAGKDRMEAGLHGVFLKNNQHFVPGNELEKYSKIIFDELKSQNYLKNSKDLNHFAKDMANFMMELNALHPFREGNGRTQRIFLNDLAKNAGYKLDLNLIPKEKMIEASIKASQLKPAMLEALIKTNLKSFKQNLEKENALGLSLC
ncbi:cell filamentation protein [Campylobacter hyointestinalis subsp. hyointestinalis]|uniref:protein adenylyltransferase n=1 Tax=Campylobacter hyointestinalis subsp. hyointestinalis TaxID=91352 RepID=A0A0S4SVG7_CAMHY|nr:Fic family protein [Campylobacter hyointestinalis]CUU90372.1 cell filamentation protein [Campylobacter hyointestinalis subsp. hyointestinalis]